jgi:pilus assembly protein CpaC
MEAGAQRPAAPSTRRAVRRAVVLGTLFTVATTLALSTIPPPAAAAPVTHEKLYVQLRKSLLLDLGQVVETVSIADPELADFVVAAQTQVLIQGKKQGTTSLVVWTRGGQARMYDLEVQRGFAYKQIMLNVRVAEINQSTLSEYGLDYLVRQFGAGDRSAGIFSGGVGQPAIPLAAGSSDASGTEIPRVGQTFPDEASLVFRYLKAGEQFEVLIHALEQKGLLKVLARPNLVCVDGKEASFLAGGEIPIPVAQTSAGGGTSVTIEWREFGVKVGFVPTVVDSDLVNLKVEPEVSSLDFNNAIAIGGFVVPALRTRRAATEVELRGGESLVVGGLKSSGERSVVNKIPILGDIPLLGYLFQSRSKATESNELMILVSPRIVTPLPPGQEPPLPWEGPQTPKRSGG